MGAAGLGQANEAVKGVELPAKPPGMLGQKERHATQRDPAFGEIARKLLATFPEDLAIEDLPPRKRGMQR